MVHVSLMAQFFFLVNEKTSQEGKKPSKTGLQERFFSLKLDSVHAQSKIMLMRPALEH